MTLEIKAIKDTSSEEFLELWRIYEDSFPLDERRSFDKQIKILDRKEYSLNVIKNKSKIIGLLGKWDFKDFTFGEHLAIKKELRNKGFGTLVINEWLKNEKLVIGEVEKPSTNEAKRRITFYKKIGFKVNKHKYIQPPYGVDKKAVPMLIISYPKLISVEEFTKIRDKIHKKVYGLSKILI